MNKNLLLVGGGLLALMVLKPASATTRARGFGNGYTPQGQGSWGSRSSYYNNSPSAQRGSGANQSISQMLGLASVAKSLGVGEVFSSIGQSIGGLASGLGAASDLALGSTALDYAAADALTADWLTSFGADAAGSAVADAALADSAMAYAPWVAAAAAIDSEVFGGEVGQTVVDSVDGLGNSVADIFGW